MAIGLTITVVGYIGMCLSINWANKKYASEERENCMVIDPIIEVHLEE